MLLKGVVDEDFINFKNASMFLICHSCNFKCDKLSGKQVCQNGTLAKSPDINIDIDNLIKRYLKNDISKAIVFGGLEPLEQFEDLYGFIRTLRTKYRCNDTVVIYTGFNKTEILSQIEILKQFKNIVVKFGRYIPNQEKHYDEVLGVHLASDNQFAEVIS